VVEPTQAAVTMAVGRVRLGWNGRAASKCDAAIAAVEATASAS